MEANPGTTNEACASVIVTKTKAASAALRAQVEHGASFATLAKQHSIDTQTASKGGAIGCAMPYEFAAPLNSIVAATHAGQVSQPIDFNGEWVLLEVTSRQPGTTEQAVTSIYAGQQAELGAALAAIMRSAEVQVSSQYGSWASIRSTSRVVPPVPPPPKLVPNPSANLGTTPTSAPSSITTPSIPTGSGSSGSGSTSGASG